MSGAQNSLGVGFLNERRPELVGLVAVAAEVELAADGGQSVVDDHLLPLAEPPEEEVKHTCRQRRRGTVTSDSDGAA